MADVFSKKNMRTLSWIGGGLVPIVIGLWAAFVYFDQRGADKDKSPKQSADHGGVVIGGNAERTTINTR